MKFLESETPLKRFSMSPLRASTILIGFAVPISVALDNLLLAIVLLGMAIHSRQVWQVVTQNPVARAAWLLFGMLLLAVLYGETPWRQASGILGKYADLAFIPLFILILSDTAARRMAQYAFLAAMALILLLSGLVGLEILAVQPWMALHSTPSNPVIFHSSITQNNMMAFAGFLALLNLREAASLPVRLAWGGFAALAIINVLFMVPGRTGYLILLILAGWFVWSTMRRNTRIGKRLGWKLGVVTGICFIGLIALIYNTSQSFHERMTAAVTQFQSWQPGFSYEQSDTPRSIAVTRRLDFYYNTWHVVQQHPLLGVGTGGFPAAYAQQVGGHDTPAQPHNEYLMIASQTGLAGLALLLYLFYTLWRTAPRLPTAFEQDAGRGLVLAYLVNCTFNSALLDHSDGLFFAFMTAVLFANLKQEVQRD